MTKIEKPMATRPTIKVSGARKRPHSHGVKEKKNKHTYGRKQHSNTPPTHPRRTPSGITATLIPSTPFAPAAHTERRTPHTLTPLIPSTNTNTPLIPSSTRRPYRTDSHTENHPGHTSLRGLRLRPPRDWRRCRHRQHPLLSGGTPDFALRRRGGGALHPAALFPNAPGGRAAHGPRLRRWAVGRVMRGASRAPTTPLICRGCVCRCVGVNAQRCWRGVPQGPLGGVQRKELSIPPRPRPKIAA
eukprot:COSAG01_NODE_3867_length_5609_cov_9.646461_3_plen_244_part_00